MRVVRRPFRCPGRASSGPTPFVMPGGRPACMRLGAAMAPMPYTMSGPVFKGMDPSDPLTYTRDWNPQPGMIGQLNFDGAQLQGRTPTQLQRGPQARPRKLRLW